MEGEYVIATATIIAAIVTFLSSICVSIKTSKSSKASNDMYEELSRITREHERSQSLLNSVLEKAVHKSNSFYSKKLEVLSYSYNLLGSIKFLVESYLNPCTTNSRSGDPKKL